MQQFPSKAALFVCKQTSPTVLHFFPPPELSCSVVSSSSSSSCATVELCAGACARRHARTHALASVRVRAGTSLLTDCLRLQLAEAAAPLPSLRASTLSWWRVHFHLCLTPSPPSHVVSFPSSDYPPPLTSLITVSHLCNNLLRHPIQ